jgi:hypothetical protein
VNSSTPAAGQVTLNGSAQLSGSALQLTNLSTSESGAAWYATPVNVQAFTTDRVAVKFDLYNNNGEGTDSTGLYTDGAVPTVPAIDMTSSGVNLHSGDTMAVCMVYNGTTLTMTITDTVTNASFSNSWTINIPAIVGGNTAYVGFTGGTGGLDAIQDILIWTYSQT